MASPPAKRQRTTKIVFSDDEEEESETASQGPPPRRISSSIAARARKVTAPSKTTKSTGSKSKSKPSTNTAPATPRKAAAKTASASPVKSNKSPRRKKTEGNSRSLHAFFGRASEEQRWNRNVDTTTAEVDDVENGDAIEDDDGDDDSLGEAFSQLAEGQEDIKFQLDRRKDRLMVTSNASQTVRSSPLASSHKFVKPPLPSINKNGLNIELDDNSNKHLHRPWADRYGPSNLEELAVHKKKVADVHKWLGEVLNGQDPRKILVLKGPAGSGKTTSVSLLSATLNFTALHWANPTVSDASMTASIASQFDDFVNRSGNFGSLEFDASNSSPSDVASDHRSELPSRVLVVEEFPTNMTRSSSALEAFRSVILRYLATSPPASNPLFRKSGSSLETRPPLVLIISESLLTSATASADSFTAHRLLGPDITNHPLVTVMEFNTVAPTFIAKALDLVIKKEARDSQRRRIPGPAVIKKLSEMGDIRSAINALEFLCARSADSDDWSGRVAAKMKKSYKDGAALTPMEKSSLELVTQREATLGMFHAVGKVIYNKREEPQIADPTAEPPPKPPGHLEHMHKSKAPLVSVDDLMNETGTDIPTFVSTLHENYILSCNGLSFLESFDNCIDALSDSDILSPERGSMSRINYGRSPAGNGLSHAGGIDMLRQNEITFHVAVRGLLFGLPHPVNRAAYPGGRKGDTYKMFYPASLRLWKPMEEIGSLISTLMDETMFAGPAGAVRGRDPENGVASWKQKNETFDATSEDESISTTSRILASKNDMLYDRLPYLSKFHDVEGLDMRKVKQVTQFRGTRLPEEDDYEGYELETAIDLSAANETTDGATTSPKKRGRIMTIAPGKVSGEGVALEKGLNNGVQLEKLYISDDDIQDD